MVANKLYKYLDAKGGMMMLYHSNHRKLKIIRICQKKRI